MKRQKTFEFLGTPGLMIYREDMDTLQELTDAQFGRLMKSLFRFARTGEAENAEDPALRIAFAMMRQRLLRDEEAYRLKVEQRRAAGQASARKRSQARQAVEDGPVLRAYEAMQRQAPPEETAPQLEPLPWDEVPLPWDEVPPPCEETPRIPTRPAKRARNDWTEEEIPFSDCGDWTEQQPDWVPDPESDEPSCDAPPADGETVSIRSRNQPTATATTTLLPTESGYTGYHDPYGDIPPLPQGEPPAPLPRASPSPGGSSPLPRRL